MCTHCYSCELAIGAHFVLNPVHCWNPNNMVFKSKKIAIKVLNVFVISIKLGPFKVMLDQTIFRVRKNIHDSSAKVAQNPLC